MKNLKRLTKMVCIALLMLCAYQNVSAQYYVNMNVSSGTGSLNLCQGSTYIVTFTGLPTGYCVCDGSSDYGSWSNGTPSCIAYGTDEVALCLNGSADNSVAVTAYYGGNTPYHFTANFYPYTTTISGVSTFCSTSNETYTCTTNVPGVGTNGYTWTLPTFLSGSSTTYQIATTTTGTGTGSVGVTVSGSPGCPIGSASNTAFDGVTSDPTTISTPTALSYQRAGSTCYYNAHVNTVTGAEYYDWSANSSFTSLYGTTTSPTTTGADFDGTTTYTIYVRARNPCATSGTLTSIKETPTPPQGCIEGPVKPNKNNQIKAITDYKIYPNPANSNLTVEYPVSTDNAVMSLNLYDMFGQKIIGRGLTSTNGIATENISELSPGLYLYTITSGNNIVNRGKLIVQR